MFEILGGTLRIFGESLNKDVPYKTLLISTKDTAAFVVKEALEKYCLEKEDPSQFCLVQVIVPLSNGNANHHAMNDFYNPSDMREYILDDEDCPLAIENSHNKSRGTLTFHIRRRPADYQPRKRKKHPKQIKGELEAGYTKYDESLERLPYLLELNPDGSEVARGFPKKHYLYLNVTEIGSERSSNTNQSQCLQLNGPNVQPRHCVIAHTEGGIVTVTPRSKDSETYVNGQRIYETTILQHGMIVRFGKLNTFKYIDPLLLNKPKHSPDSSMPTMPNMPRKIPSELHLVDHGRVTNDTHQNSPNVPPSEPRTEPATPTLSTTSFSYSNSNVPQMPPFPRNSTANSIALPQNPEIQVLKLEKSNTGMGLSIVAMRGSNQDKLGVYIKSVVKGGAADRVSWKAFAICSIVSFI